MSIHGSVEIEENIENFEEGDFEVFYDEEEKGNERFRCTFVDCSKDFFDQNSLKKHLITHGDKTVFKK